METKRLYFADSYMTEFRARVVERGIFKGKPAVVLDQSAFYPEGGGQPADTGSLDGVRVLDVQADDRGQVWHVLSAPLSAETVQGRVDWPRRFDHMQQHHGQHLLSAAFETLYGFRTASFHLGTQTATIDLAIDQATEEQRLAAEELTNRVIWEDHPVLARFVTPEELSKIPLRKPPAVGGAIRVVSAGDFDHSACGGTHPSSTGAVGVLHVRRLERRGTETRVEFVCGGRALRDLRFLNGLVSRVANGLSVGPAELEATIARLRESEEGARKRAQTLAEELSGFEADQLVAHAPRSGDTPIVRRIYPERTLNELRYLAAAIAVRGGIALLALSGEKAQIVLARSAESTVDCGKLLKETLGQFGGKGGGQSAMAQGGVPDPNLLDQAMDLIARRLQADPGMTAP